MTIEFEKLYDVIKDATKPCDKDYSFNNPQACRDKKRDYYTELIKYLYTLKVPLQNALNSHYIINDKEHKHLNEDQQIALQKMEKQVNTLIEQTERNIVERKK